LQLNGKAFGGLSVIMRFLERQIDRAFRHGTDGSVIFQPFWGTAYLVPSAKRETELRDGWRRFTMAAWLFALGCPLLSVSGRFASSWLWSSTGSLAVLKTSLLVRLAVALLYFSVGTWWLWWSLRGLTSDLQPTMTSWVPPGWIRRAAHGATRRGLVFMAVAGSLVGVGSVVVLLSWDSFRFYGAVSSCWRRSRRCRTNRSSRSGPAARPAERRRSATERVGTTDFYGDSPSTRNVALVGRRACGLSVNGV